MAGSGLSLPPPKIVLAELGGALVGGLIIAPLAYLLVGVLFMGAGLGMGLLTLQVFGIVIGFGLGAGLGAGLVGRWMGQPGNFWLAMAAGGATALIVVLGMRLLNVGGLGGLFVGIPLALIAAIIGLNARRGL
jgi:hypothetical protein